MISAIRGRVLKCWHGDNNEIWEPAYRVNFEHLVGTMPHSADNLGGARATLGQNLKYVIMWVCAPN